MVILIATRGDPDLRPHSEVSDLGLRSLSITLVGGVPTKMGYKI